MILFSIFHLLSILSYLSLNVQQLQRRQQPIVLSAEEFLDNDEEQPPPRSPRTSTTKRYGNINTSVARTDKHFKRHPTRDSSECEEEDDPFGISSEDDDDDEAEMDLQPEEAANNNEGREGFFDSNGAPLSPIRNAREDPFGPPSEDEEEWCLMHPEDGDPYWLNLDTEEVTYEHPYKDILSCK